MEQVATRDEPRGWAAVVFPLVPGQPIFGGVEGSSRLHLNAEGARSDAEEMCRKRGVSPGDISWETVADGIVIGRCARFAIVVRSILLPKGCDCDV
jgi:hypothetical protein